MERDPKKIVSMEVTEANLTYFRAAVRAGASGGAEEEGDAGTGASPCKGVYLNRRRNGIIFRFKSKDGAWTSKSRKLSPGDDVKTVASELVEKCVYTQ